MATLSFADIYNTPSAAGATTPAGASVQVKGPNQSSVTSSSSDLSVNMSGNFAAFSWLGMLLAIVAIRVFVEIGGR